MKNRILKIFSGIVLSPYYLLICFIGHFLYWTPSLLISGWWLVSGQWEKMNDD